MIGQSVSSSNLRFVAYEPWSATLTVEFQNETVYEFDGVPPGIYGGLVNASSPGRFFWQHIRGRFPYRRVQ
jgi:hypothetical protein